MKKSSVVLVSGGLDSAVCLAEAVSRHGKGNVLALSMYYGQKHSKELKCAAKVTKYFGVEHITRDLSSVFEFSDCSLLTKSSKDIAKGSYADQQKEELTEDRGAVSTYVPFRNGLFLSYVAAIAISVGASEIVYGAHADDAAGNAYPDCSQEFYKAMNDAIYIGSGKQVKLHAPLIDLTKSGVVKLGTELKVPFELTWSCYTGGKRACGECGTCIDRIKAFKENGLVDPILYENQAIISEDDEFIYFSKSWLLENDIIGNALENNILDVDRWSVVHEIIFQYKDKYYRSTYSVGATELQGEAPWEFADESIPCEEVEEVRVAKKVWTPVTKK